MYLMRIVITVVMFSSIMACATPGSIPPPLESRISALQAKIERGIQSGSLSPSEAERAQRGFSILMEKKANYEADGFLSSSERDTLHRDLDHLEDMVLRFMDN